MMIGGEPDVVKHLDPIFATLAPGRGRHPAHRRAAKRSAARRSRAICIAGRTGPGTSSRWCTTASSTASWPRMPRGWESCATRTSASTQHEVDAETTPLRDPEHYQYDLNLRDIAEVWRRGSVIASWLLDLTATSLVEDPELTSSPAAFPIRAKGAGRSRPRSTKPCRCRCFRPRSISDSVRAAKPTSRTSCSRRCGSSSAGTWKNQRSRGTHDERSSFRCTGVLRRHGRSGLQEDLPVAAGDGEARRLERAGHRRGQGRVGISINCKARARDSVEKHGGVDAAAFEKLSGLLRYVDGDYNDPATFQAIRKELGAAQRPAHYLAIPPVLFGPVVEQLAKGRIARAAHA